jgi:hypothetical protein
MIGISDMINNILKSMENKLEMKHLAPYLEHELKAKYQHRTIEILGLKNNTPWSGQLSVQISKALWTYGYEIRPILRPLSDLTKEIDHNGEKFVPIVELAKIATKEKKCYITNANQGTCYVDAEFNKKGFFIYSQNTFMWQVGSKAEPQIVWNQISLFNKLFQWHFDVFSLIEKGLAVPLT